MTEIYDMVMMVGDLVLILVFFWFIAAAGLFFLDEFSGASSRIIQEFVSGYASMSNFAPDSFSAGENFPAVNHMMKISENVPFVSIKTGTKGSPSSYSYPITGGKFEDSIMLSFVQKPPLSYFLSKSVILLGDCLDNFCAFSDKSQNKIKIIKKENSVSFLLNRDSLSTGSYYSLGKKIFSGECDSKTYVAYYKYANINSIHVEVSENGQIIKEGPNPTIEVFKETPKIINNLKITLYSMDAATNIASITANCN